MIFSDQCQALVKWREALGWKFLFNGNLKGDPGRAAAAISAPRRSLDMMARLDNEGCLRGSSSVSRIEGMKCDNEAVKR